MVAWASAGRVSFKELLEDYGPRDLAVVEELLAEAQPAREVGEVTFH
jgi:hypothetical protein